ncbi:MAG: cytochrome c maturation protein CcmE [Rhodobacteraceae bacterium]|jgi:cytochrome c-type biogenesis protein CcmE|nr:cytochrome c maturation protein CcmE [Paracoccaceae bacterium]MBC8407807.1 cytochrome c maturation protein CcmE [Paracoccaceae bacterium]MBT4284561.1 cytochrome c maturation protein CcmE [Paracoccaceae bacterium]MBT4776759.1 cytochrome c maturation protein CcmE [Paracoccaceae bacterium]MBT6437994.1 cytochrome c maturation protein CcmE [Paracoccaceae bacterium]|tara:strand:- start:83 stop:529 length:447 start_codon:yes stop_codon:yes gene_type:complete
MRSLEKRRRIQVIIILLGSLLIASVLIGYGLREGISYFKSPTELTSSPPRSDQLIRVGGLVEGGSIKMKADGEISFLVTDQNKSIEVRYRGILPDLFSENQGVIGSGYFVEGIFEANEILAKHDEKYMPIEVIDTLKKQGVYKVPNSN